MKVSDLFEEPGYLTEQDLFEMANVAASESGLDVYVFVSPKGGARHGPRIKVCNTKGKMNEQDVFTITIPELRVVGNCKLDSDTIANINDWIMLNQDILVKYWNGVITTGQFFQNMKKI